MMLVNLKSDFCKSRKSQFSVKIVEYHLVLCETAQLKLILIWYNIRLLVHTSSIIGCTERQEERQSWR